MDYPSCIHDNTKGVHLDGCTDLRPVLRLQAALDMVTSVTWSHPRAISWSLTVCINTGPFLSPPCYLCVSEGKEWDFCIYPGFSRSYILFMCCASLPSAPDYFKPACPWDPLRRGEGRKRRDRDNLLAHSITVRKTQHGWITVRIHFG